MTGNAGEKGGQVRSFILANIEAHNDDIAVFAANEFGAIRLEVNLAKRGPDQLISRSQAKHLLAPVELFKTVIFDFKDVEQIGQAFADQIFRVFANGHPEIALLPVNMSKDVSDMVSRAQSKRGA